MFTLGFLSAILLSVVAVWGFLEFGFADFRSDESPPLWESELMGSAIHASLNRQAPKGHVPFDISDERLIKGGRLYMHNCVGCHGAPNKPPSDFGETFYPPAPQFAHVGTQRSEAEVFWIAKHGIRRTGMLPQGLYYSDDELWSLAAFITRVKNLSPAVLKTIGDG